MTDLSLIKTIKDVIENADLIIKTAEISPAYDPILVISLDEITDVSNVIMMGDGIVKKILQLLKLEQQNVDKGCGKYLRLAPDIESNNVDLYFLKIVDLVDIPKHYNIRNIIHSKFSVNYLVIDKYLPFNRIASNSKQNLFYVSLQCLYSLLTGNCLLPKYLQKFDYFISSIYNGKYVSENIHEICKHNFNQINCFIEIYEKHGYTFNYIETKTIIPSLLESNYRRINYKND